ncbi:MAG: hypothetical protein KKA60_07735, partial [Proteobacteria bacterium]|nr:hypothetical protein [Pseudomonadota bacterium]
ASSTFSMSSLGRIFPPARLPVSALAALSGFGVQGVRLHPSSLASTETGNGSFMNRILNEQINYLFTYTVPERVSRAK